ncbi:MAG TPA: winged helix-turn-helix domain-containing protein [Candidatus Rubrimentiphilum sp.]|nr:winged helix-turn-helix domain-containing protein [Candidatus Rubrimentiphilum sp.]
MSFGDFVFDPSGRVLLKRGHPVRMQAKVFDLLEIFITRPGECIGRAELYEALWPQSIVEESNLTQAVYMLRRALDEGGDGRTYVETAPRRGYKFVHPLRILGPSTRHGASRLPLLRSFYAAACILATVLLATSPVRTNSVPLVGRSAAAYSLGQYHLNLRTRANLHNSIAYFKQTTALAPASALGFAGLAVAYGLEAEYDPKGTRRREIDVSLAGRFSKEALARDATGPEAQTASAFLAYRFHHDPERAEMAFQEALRANPDYAPAHHLYALLLFSRGAIPAAVQQLESAHRSDPTAEVTLRWLGRAYIYDHRPGEAIRVLREALEIESADVPARLALATAQAQEGDLKGASSALRALRRAIPGLRDYVYADEALVLALMKHGHVEHWQRQRVERLLALRRIEPAEAAAFYLSIGQRNAAMHALEIARPDTPLAAALERFDPRLATLGSDHRFQQLFN